MAWVRIDDQVPRHQKMLHCGPAACWLWVCGIAHAQSQLTDGFISDEVLPMIGVTGAPRCRRLAETLVKYGLFDRVAGGYRVHDYLDLNPARTLVLAKRADDLERKRKGEEHRESIGRRAFDSTRNPAGIQTDSSAPRAGVPSHPIPSDEREREARAETALTERAGRLRQELYPRWYTKWRHGAKLCLGANALEFQEALGLVRTWDDQRLEQLAQIVLTTDEPFIAKTDRSFKIFAMKASWADNRLRQAENGTA